MEFIYRGRDQQGNPVEGNVSAANVNGAINILQQRGIVVVKLDEQASETTIKTTDFRLFKEKISADELILLTRQLYALTKAGIPIVRALNGLAESNNNGALKQVLRGISDALVSGSELSTAFGQYPKLFSPIYISMVRIGETTGNLDNALINLVSHLEMERETKKRVKAALRYPTMVLLAMAVALVVITLFVIPNFTGVFAKLGADLPFATQLLMMTSDFMQNNWLIMLVAVIVGWFGFKRYVQSDTGSLWWDEKKLNLLLLGSIFERIALARFSRSFSMMMAAGVPILQSLSIVADSVGNKFIGAAVSDMLAGVERGDRLTNTASASGLFTPLVLQMMAVGEETGAIDQLLAEVADFYEQEVDYELKQLADAIEPILLAFLGGLVLILALGVFLPIWELSTAAR